MHAPKDGARSSTTAQVAALLEILQKRSRHVQPNKRHMSGNQLIVAYEAATGRKLQYGPKLLWYLNKHAPQLVISSNMFGISTANCVPTAAPVTFPEKLKLDKPPPPRSVVPKSPPAIREYFAMQMQLDSERDKNAEIKNELRELKAAYQEVKDENLSTWTGIREICSLAKSTAKAQADDVVRSARDEADNIVRRANDEADSIVRRANDEAEDIVRQAATQASLFAMSSAGGDREYKLWR